MDEPAFNSDGYPTRETEYAIANWPWQDILGLFRFIESVWNNMGSFTWGDDGKVSLVTGGWSGNEQLVNALLRNSMVMTLSWKLSQRGGYYEFEIPEDQREAADAEHIGD